MKSTFIRLISCDLFILRLLSQPIFLFENQAREILNIDLSASSIHSVLDIYAYLPLEFTLIILLYAMQLMYFTLFMMHREILSNTLLKPACQVRHTIIARWN